MARPDQLRGQAEENPRQLGRDHLGLVSLRTLSVSKPAGEHFAALTALRGAGLVRRLGLSNVTAGQIGEALAIAPVAAVQNRCSIDSRRPEADDVLRACAERGTAFVPFFAIAGEGREGGRRAAAGPGRRPRARRDACSGPAGLDAGAAKPRAGDPRNWQPGAPGPERGRRRSAPDGRRPGPPGLPGCSGRSPRSATRVAPGARPPWTSTDPAKAPGTVQRRAGMTPVLFRGFARSGRRACATSRAR